MKRVVPLLIVIAVVLTAALPAMAAGGNVTYSGNAGQFIFAPGSEYSPTDLFTAFKSVMPGDSITQQITVQNRASDQVKVKLYMRALGAQSESHELLSQLNLRVEKAEQNKMGYMFDAPANQTAGLTDWVCLGTLYSGGTVDLNVTLDVPVELDNSFKAQAAALYWEFMAEEFPAEDSDPKPPDTGDHSGLLLWIIILVCAAVLLVLLPVWHKKRQR